MLNESIQTDVIRFKTTSLHTLEKHTLIYDIYTFFEKEIKILISSIGTSCMHK